MVIGRWPAVICSAAQVLSFRLKKQTSKNVAVTTFKEEDYISGLYYFDKRGTFEAHFVKISHKFDVDLKLYFKYTLISVL